MVTQDYLRVNSFPGMVPNLGPLSTPLCHDTTTISNVAGSSSMFLEDDKVIDHPMRLNFDSKKLIDGENLEIKDIFCGASGTAFTTPFHQKW
jgi:hypothetical protein